MTRTFVYRATNARTGKALGHPVIATIIHDWWRDGIRYAHVDLSRPVEHDVRSCVTMVAGPILQVKEGNECATS